MKKMLIVKNACILSDNIEGIVIRPVYIGRVIVDSLGDDRQIQEKKHGVFINITNSYSPLALRYDTAEEAKEVMFQILEWITPDFEILNFQDS